MIVLFYCILAITAIAFDTQVGMYALDWVGAKPDAILLAAVFLGLRRDRATGLIGGFVLGLFQDVLSGGLLGLNALLKGLIGHYAGGQRNASAHATLFQCTLALLASIIHILFSAALVKIFLPDQTLPAGYWTEGIRTVGLNVLLAPVFIGLLSMIERKILPSSTGAPYTERA